MLIDTVFARDMYQVYEINDDWLINARISRSSRLAYRPTGLRAMFVFLSWYFDFLLYFDDMWLYFDKYVGPRGLRMYSISI